MQICDNHELREKVRAVLSMPGPVVCEVMATPDEVRAPRLSSKQLANGSMVSRAIGRFVAVSRARGVSRQTC